jgi:hypothetical protein
MVPYTKWHFFLNKKKKDCRQNFSNKMCTNKELTHCKKNLLDNPRVTKKKVSTFRHKKKKEKKNQKEKQNKKISVTAECLPQTFLKLYLCFSFFKVSVSHMGR